MILSSFVRCMLHRRCVTLCTNCHLAYRYFWAKDITRICHSRWSVTCLSNDITNSFRQLSLPFFSNCSCFVSSEVLVTRGHRCPRSVSIFLHGEGAIYLQRILQPHQSTVMYSIQSATSRHPFTFTIFSCCHPYVLPCISTIIYAITRQHNYTFASFVLCISRRVNIIIYLLFI